MDNKAIKNLESDLWEAADLLRQGFIIFISFTFSLFGRPVLPTLHVYTQPLEGMAVEDPPFCG